MGCLLMRKLQQRLLGSSLAVQWLGLSAFTVGAPASIPGRETKIPQPTQHSQKYEQYPLKRVPGMYWAPLFHEIFQNDRKTLKITKYISHHSDVNNRSYLLKIFLMSTFLKVFIEFFTILPALCFAGLFVFAWRHVGSQLPNQESKPLHWKVKS